jgi:hypothetical protein
MLSFSDAVGESRVIKVGYVRGALDPQPAAEDDKKKEFVIL